MTTPSGRPGFNAIDRFGITGDDGSVPDLVNRTQEVITGILKERIKASPGWNGSTADVWAQLRRGIPLDHALLEVIVNRLTGGLVVFPTKQDAIMALKKVPFLDDLVEFLTGIEDGDEDDLGTFFLNLRRFFQSIDFTDPDFDPAVVHKAFVEIVVQPFIKTITKITSALLGPLSIGFLTDEIQTLLFEGGFDDPITIVPGAGVEHDATDGVPLTTPIGCAKVTCDGTDKSRASEVIKVGPGWVLKLGGRIKYQGLTAGANAIRLNLIPYSNESTPLPGGAIMVATAGTVSGTSTGVNGWGLLPIEGTWTVPDTGVSHVVVEWHVTDAATSGVVKFDELYLQSTEKIPQSFTKDLPEDLQSLVNEALSLWQGLGERLHVDEWDDWLADTWAHTQAEANQIRDILAGLIVTPINSAVQAIKDWWTGIVGKTQNLTSGGTLPPTKVSSPLGGSNIGQDVLDTLNKLWDGFKRSTGSTGKTPDDVQAAAGSVWSAVDQVTNNTESLASTILLPRTKSLWESKWPQDDVSFPVFNIDGYSTPTLGRLYLIPVTASADREYQSLKFAIQGTSMTNCYVGVYTIDTATGQATLISNLGDVKSSLSGSVEQQSLALPESISAAKGQTFYVGVLQVGGSAAGMKRSSLTDTMTDYPTSHPQFFGNIVTGTLGSLPSTIAAANITVSTRFWAALGYGVSPPPPPKLYFADSFNGADGALSSNWIARKKYNIGLVISGNAVRTGDTGSGSHSAVPKFTTNNQGVRMTAPTNNNGFSALFLRASSSMMVGFIYGTSASDKRIVTCPGYDIGNNNFENCTTRATSSNPFPGPGSGSYVTELTAVGNVYTAKWTNGSSGLVTVTWTDTGGIVPIGAGQREAVIAIDYDSPSSSFIDNFEMWDI